MYIDLDNIIILLAVFMLGLIIGAGFQHSADVDMCKEYKLRFNNCRDRFNSECLHDDLEVLWYNESFEINISELET